MAITAVVLAKDEEKNIGECLSTLQWCDEIIVIDDYSSDRTREIARESGAKVFSRHLNNDFAAQRNFGLEKASGEWVFFLDADERVSPRLAEEIKLKINDKTNSVNGYYFRRADYCWGKMLCHGETAEVKLLRLARKGKGLWKRKVHELWEISGPTGELKEAIIHRPHPSMTEFLEHINFHSTLHAESFYKKGVRSSLFRIIFNPLGKFLVNYFWRLGFLDGMPGFITALMMSFHSFLAWSKLYLLWKKR